MWKNANTVNSIFLLFFQKWPLCFQNMLVLQTLKEKCLTFQRIAPTFPSHHWAVGTLLHVWRNQEETRNGVSVMEFKWQDFEKHEFYERTVRNCWRIDWGKNMRTPEGSFSSSEKSQKSTYLMRPYWRIGPWSYKVGKTTIWKKNLTSSINHSTWAVPSMRLSHFSRVQLCATPYTAAYQVPLSLGFSRQEYWSGLPSLFRLAKCY